MDLSILLINLEFMTWSRGRHLSYCAQLGLSDGLRANHVDHLILPSLWLRRAKDILRGKKFDQLWVELVHTNLEGDFYKSLSGIAKTRVGLLLESAEYSAEEYKRHPFLKNRRQLVQKRLDAMTHLIVCDERDAEYFGKFVPTFWWPQAVPRRFISESPAPLSAQHATFCGALYGERKAWMNNPDLQKLLVRPPSAEDHTPYPGQFNRLNLTHYPFMKIPLPMTPQRFKKYMESLRLIRQRCFELWLESLRSGCAVVNLPHRVKTYAGRVVEAMAAGVPVISWEIPDRPRNKALFQDGKEILLFSKNNPEQLIALIKGLIQSPQRMYDIAKSARERILTYHTVEKRVEQILEWINNKKDPKYHE